LHVNAVCFVGASTKRYLAVAVVGTERGSAARPGLDGVTLEPASQLKRIGRARSLLAIERKVRRALGDAGGTVESAENVAVSSYVVREPTTWRMVSLRSS